MFADVLCCGDPPQCLAELEEVPVSSLWPRNSTLRALASLLSTEDPQVNKAAADYLSSGASCNHFRTRVSTSRREDVLNNLDGCSMSCVNVLACPCLSTGSGLLHPGAVRSWRSEPEGSLFSPQLPAGQWPHTGSDFFSRSSTTSRMYVKKKRCRSLSSFCHLLYLLAV